MDYISTLLCTLIFQYNVTIFYISIQKKLGRISARALAFAYGAYFRKTFYDDKYGLGKNLFHYKPRSN